MVVLLFGLILFRGLSFFWPVPVVQIELDEASESTFRGSTTFAGAVAKTQQRTDRVLAESPEEAGEAAGMPETYTEIQLFLGNRDVYAQSFRYFREDDIVSRRFPEDIIRAERRAEGDAIFYAREIRFDDGTAIGAEEEGFEASLERLVDEAGRRRSEIERIERREIGPINLARNATGVALPRTPGRVERRATGEDPGAAGGKR